MNPREVARTTTGTHVPPNAKTMSIAARSRLEQPRDLLRRILHVDVEHADILAAGRAVAAADRDVLAELRLRVITFAKRSARRSRGALRGLARAVVVDEDQLDVGGDVGDAQIVLEHPHKFRAERCREIRIAIDRDDE